MEGVVVEWRCSRKDFENKMSHPGEIRRKTPLKYGAGTDREKMVAAVKQAGEKMEEDLYGNFDNHLAVQQ